MAKINKYWGMLALGAVTAAVAGAVAATFTNRKALKEAADFDDDFDDDFDNEKEASDSPKKEAREDFISWEASSDEEAATLSNNEKTVSEEKKPSENTGSESAASDSEAEDSDAVASALKEAEETADAFEKELADAKKEQEEEESSIHID